MNLRHTKPGAAVLVIGAGLAGMTAAHHLAEWGARIYLADRAPHLGGAFLMLDHTFATDSCGLCIALPRQPSYCPTIASELHPRITPLPRTTLGALEGAPSNFVARLCHAPCYVDPCLCDNCGACATVCPVPRPRSRWGRSLHEHPQQKAIYPPPPRAVPLAYAIDPDLCTRCGACVDVCPRGAINLETTPTERRVEIDALILSPGFASFDAAHAIEYGWGRCANVVTSLEFERLLNRSGPTGGRPLRPTDGQLPDRIAFIQCVGSRSERLGRPYCSTSCCMITAKQVGLTVEVAPETQVTVYTMDVRAAGKGYERYIQRVAALPGVTYRWGRPAAVHEIPRDRSLRLLTPDGEQVFDLVVLAVGMGPADGVRELAARAGVALDEHGYLLPGDDGLGSTSRQGIYAAGSALAPADVPKTVTQAAAAAALVAQTLPPVPSPSPSPRKQEEEKGRLDQPPRIGLFLCTCHGTLEEMLDFAVLTAAGKRLRAVVHVEQLEAACKTSGLSTIEQAVAEHDLNRIIVVGCSPRLHAAGCRTPGRRSAHEGRGASARFDALMDRLCLPRRLLAHVDVRRGAACGRAGSHAATTVAQSELTMAVAGLRETPFRPFNVRSQENVARRVLVLGGGLAGMTAALALAGLGIDSDLVERGDQLGGNLSDIRYTLEGRDAQALLAKMVARVQKAERVRVWTEAELASWSGVRGAFAAEVRFVAEPSSRASRPGSAKTQTEGVRQERYGALIVATGAEPATTSEYLYGEHERVITQRELDHLLASDPVSSAQCPAFSVQHSVSSVVMIQCVGSRDETHPYCSRICCAQAIRNALALKELEPSIEISVLFRDIRTMGTHELIYQQARRSGVRFLRYEPPEKPAVRAEGARLSVTVHDTLYDELVTLKADLLVLSTGIAPPEKDNRHLADMLGVSLDEDGFYAEAHPKLRPTDLAQPGVYLCGLAYGPCTIEESIAQAQSAALRAALTVARPPEPRHDVATVVEKLCSFCGLCVTHCPYGARILVTEEHLAHVRCARVIDYLCQGCGACVAVCPNGASRQPALEPVQLLALVDAALIE